VPGEGSFLARCALKFSEVVAAGVATALSGYLIAHFVAPMFSATQPAGSRPAATDDSAPLRPSPDAALVDPAKVGAALPKMSPTKTKAVETGAAQPVPGATAARRLKDAATRKPDAAQSLEARVRAALARSNGRTALAGAPRRQLHKPTAEPNTAPGVAYRPPAAAGAASPVEDAGSLASAPRAAAPQWSDIGPHPAETPVPHLTQITGRNSGQNPNEQNIAGNPAEQKPGGQNSAIQLTPLTTVVVNPLPSLGTDSAQPVPGAVDAQVRQENRDTGPFSAFARILRSDKPLPEDQAPRPPIAVGQ
jgi:hypothetical protein